MINYVLIKQLPILFNVRNCKNIIIMFFEIMINVSINNKWYVCITNY